MKRYKKNAQIKVISIAFVFLRFGFYRDKVHLEQINLNTICLRIHTRSSVLKNLLTEKDPNEMERMFFHQWVGKSVNNFAMSDKTTIKTSQI